MSKRLTHRRLLFRSFHLSIFVFCQFWQQNYENQLSFSGKDSTAIFFLFGNFDQNTKNKKWNEPDINFGFRGIFKKIKTG